MLTVVNNRSQTSFGTMSEVSEVDPRSSQIAQNGSTISGIFEAGKIQGVDIPDVETPLIQQNQINKRSCALPMVVSAVGGVIVAGLLKTTVLNPGISSVPSTMHLNTDLEQLGVSAAMGLVTMVLGTIGGYFCQKSPQQ